VSTANQGTETGHVPTVPSRRPPLRQNFMFDVPDASVPAVDIC